MQDFIKASMTEWKTTLTLNHNKGTICREIKINSDIFQGDSLSLLLFCIALAPLPSLSNEDNYMYKISNAIITHLFYMDDLKIYAKSNEDQKDLLNTAKGFSDDIRMKFGLNE